MGPVLAALAGVLVIALAGDSVTRWLPRDREETLPERAGLALAFGLATVALGLVAGSLLVPGRVGAAWVVGPALALAAARRRPGAWLAWARALPERARLARAALDRWSLAAGAVIGSAVAGVTAVALSTGLWSDGLAIYGLKARAAFVSGGMPLSLLHDRTREFAHLEYPWLLPLDEAAFYFLGGEPLPELAKAVLPVFFAALLLLFYAALSRHASRPVALGFVALLGCLPSLVQLAGSGYADVPLALFWSGSVLHLFGWLRHGSRRDLAIAAALAAFGAWTKQEGLAFCLLQASAVAVSPLLGKTRREALASLGLFVAVSLPIVLPWLAILAVERPVSHGFARPTLALALANGNRLGVVLTSLGSEAVAWGHWGLLWILFLASLATVPASREWRTAIYLAATVLVPLAILPSSVVFTLVEPFEVHLRTSIERLFVQEAPAALFFVAVQAPWRSA